MRREYPFSKGRFYSNHGENINLMRLLAHTVDGRYLFRSFFQFSQIMLCQVRDMSRRILKNLVTSPQRLEVSK